MAKARRTKPKSTVAHSRPNHQPSGALFHPEFGKYLRDNAAEELKKVPESSQILEAITSALDATNGDVRAVQKFSGHADVRILERYDDNRQDLAGDVAKKVARDL